MNELTQKINGPNHDGYHRKHNTSYLVDFQQLNDFNVI